MSVLEKIFSSSVTEPLQVASNIIDELYTSEGEAIEGQMIKGEPNE